MQKHFCCCCFCLFNFWVIIIQVYKHQREKQYVWRVHFERQSKGTHRTWRLQSKTQAWRRWQKMSFGDSTTSIGKSWWVSLLPGWWFLLLCWTAALGSMEAWLQGFTAVGGGAVGGMEYPDPPSRIQQLLAWNHYQNRRAVHAANRSTLTDRASTPRLFRMMHSEAYHST